MNKKQSLEAVYKNFCDKTGYGVVIGVEQEFYIIDAAQNSAASHENIINYQADINKLLAAFPFFSAVEAEKGIGQFEVQIAPTNNPAIMGEIINVLRDVLMQPAKNNENPSHTAVIPSFAAKPLAGQPGSAMHIHINLVDSNGKNVFCRNGGQESPELEFAVAGLLELMPASVKYFAPYDAAYARYTEFSMDSPSTISWGGDNRTASLRIPSVPHNIYSRRIEHRLPCADADPYYAIAAILAGVEFGIVNKLANKHPKIYGNSFLPQYSLPKLPGSFAVAEGIKHEYLEQLLQNLLKD